MIFFQNQHFLRMVDGLILLSPFSYIRKVLYHVSIGD
ncbi:MAG: hypothetical protein ACFWT1_09755 [Selenomonas sp.]|jgi:hypothetical protein